MALLVVVACVVGVGAGLTLHGSLHPPKQDPRILKLREYCGQVNAAMWVDANDLATPERQHEASDRFAEAHTFHSYQEIALCSSKMPDLKGHDDCWLKRDYECLRNMARAAEAATKQ